MKLIKTLLKTTAILLIIVISFGFYVTVGERHLLRSKHIEIDIDNYNGEEIKVAQFTDTQLGEFYTLDMLQKAVNKINKEKVDVVIFTGDLIDNAAKYEEKSKISEVLKQIEAPHGKYAIYGNHDYGGGAVRYYGNIMKESGFTILKNSSTNININGTTISLFGADDCLMGDFNNSATVKGISDENINLLLVHEPDLADKFTDKPIDLILSGHSHGGQVYLPFIGPIVTTELAEKYTNGMYTLDNESKLYVNTGLGNTKVPFRFFNIPEVTIFTLK